MVPSRSPLCNHLNGADKNIPAHFLPVGEVYKTVTRSGQTTPTINLQQIPNQQSIQLRKVRLRKTASFQVQHRLVLAKHSSQAKFR